MKTKTTTKYTSALFSAIMLTSLSAHAARNIDVSHTFATANYRNADFGASATFAMFDDSSLPLGSTPGFYSLSATGNVKGKILRREFTAADAAGTAKINSEGVTGFSGRLTLLGQSVMNVSNIDMKDFRSPSFVRETSASKSVPFTIIGIPFNVTTKVKASFEARFRGDVFVTPTDLGMPQVKVSIGPEADLAATAEASLGIGIDGVAEASVGASGTLKLGKIGVKAEATAFPTVVMVREGIRLVEREGGRVEAAIVASTAGLSGNIKVFAELEVGIPFTDIRQSFRKSKTIASFTSNPTSVNLLPPVGFTWF